MRLQSCEHSNCLVMGKVLWSSALGVEYSGWPLVCPGRSSLLEFNPTQPMRHRDGAVHVNNSRS